MWILKLLLRDMFLRGNLTVRTGIKFMVSIVWFSSRQKSVFSISEKTLFWPEVHYVHQSTKCFIVTIQGQFVTKIVLISFSRNIYRRRKVNTSQMGDSCLFLTHWLLSVTTEHFFKIFWKFWSEILEDLEEISPL